ncbi:hypothetical protein IKJ53_01755 [bacterium]|nr:hypothetical protein [bacterium]
MRIISNINLPYAPLRAQFSQQNYNRFDYSVNNKGLNSDRFEHSNTNTNPISFAGSVSNGHFLRNLSGVHDPYSEIIMLNNKEMDKAKADLKKIKTTSGKLRYLSNFTDNMLPVELEIFNLLKDEFKRFKNQSLQDILTANKDQALKNLIKEEKRIFKKMMNNMEDLSPIEQVRVCDLINKSEQQIYLPHEDKSHFKKSRFISDLVRISQIDVITAIDKKIRELPEDEQKTELKKFGEAVTIFEENAYDVNMDGKTPLGMIQEFQQKYAPETIGQHNAIYPLFDIARELPTSKDNTNAFIVQMYTRTEEQIAERLISESLGTIEHIVPESLGGENEAYNFMLVSKGRNNERGNMPLEFFMKKYPDIPKYTQTYVNDIIKKCQKQKLRGHDWYPYLLRETLYEQANIKVSLDASKKSLQKAFKTIPEHLKDKYPKFKKYYSEV